MATTTPSPFESRLRSLEINLGLFDVCDRTVQDEKRQSETKPATASTTTTDSVDLNGRLEALERRYLAATTPSFRETWKESEKLLQELDPGAALTHQQQIAAPIMYRRQEVLASAETFRRDMKHVAQILNLLLIGQEQSSSSSEEGAAISEQKIVKAPILIETTGLSEDYIERLRTLHNNIADIAHRTGKVARTVDRLLEHYHALVHATSEKMVLAEEELRRIEKN